MPVSADTLSPAGINWETAMGNAAKILQTIEERSLGSNWALRSAAAQAWIAYAREITMHARAVQ